MPRRCGRRSIYLGCMRCFEKGLSHSPFSKFPFKILEVFGVLFGASAPPAFLSGNLFVLLRLFLKIFLCPSTRSGRAGAPTFLLLQKSRQKSRHKGALRPLENPLACLRAGACFARNSREGSDGTPSRCAAGASGRFEKALPAKPFRTRSHARARMIGRRSLMGNAGARGRSPHPEAVEVRQPWRARMRSRFPQRHRSSSRASGEEFG